MVVRMRSTRSHTGNRRSHHALKAQNLTRAETGAAHPRHKALLDGTPYRGRSVMDLTAKRVVRHHKAEKRRGSVAEVAKEEKKEKKEKKAKKDKE